MLTLLDMLRHDLLRREALDAMAEPMPLIERPACFIVTSTAEVLPIPHRGQLIWLKGPDLVTRWEEDRVWYEPIEDEL